MIKLWDRLTHNWCCLVAATGRVNANDIWPCEYDESKTIWWTLLLLCKNIIWMRVYIDKLPQKWSMSYFALDMAVTVATRRRCHQVKTCVNLRLLLGGMTENLYHGIFFRFCLFHCISLFYVFFIFLKFTHREASVYIKTHSTCYCRKGEIPRSRGPLTRKWDR